MSYKSSSFRSHYVATDESDHSSVAFRTLPGGSLKPWIDLRIMYRGSNNGALMATRRVLVKRGWNSNEKLNRATHELLRRGLIRYARRCGPHSFHQRVSNTPCPTSHSYIASTPGREATAFKS